MTRGAKVLGAICVAAGSMVLGPASAGAAAHHKKKTHDVILSVTGTSPATSITVLDDTGETQHENVRLPWKTVLKGSPVIVGLEAQASLSAGAVVTCMIRSPGHKAVRQRSSGPGAIVDCTASAFP